MSKVKLHSKHFFIAIIMMVWNMNPLFANNVQISNVSVIGQNITDHYSMIKFDISWENSWKVSADPGNYDAAWVFVKYRKKNTTNWYHAKIFNGSIVKPSTALVHSYNDEPIGATGNFLTSGVMVLSASNIAQSSVSYTGIQIRWEYGLNGLSDYDTVEVALYAIEMVYVKTNNYYLGSGGTESGAFFKYPNATDPYLITAPDPFSPSPIMMQMNAGELSYSGQTQNTYIDLPFPSGYYGFYCMKYEISQGQYVDFLNALTTTQASNRFMNKNGINRNNITVLSGVYSTTTPDVACNYLSWTDVAAYLDWAALRPMTELEYEKVCRGPATTYQNEYVWGNARINTTPYTFSNLGAANEGVAANFDANKGNAACASTIPLSVDGPVRCGAFAANSASVNRQTAGGSYYGAMDMSGNVAEYVVNISAGTYNGVNGDGSLSASGTANQSNWPTTTGFGTKGGAWDSLIDLLRTSDRSQVNNSTIIRSKSNGGRGVR